MTGTDAAESDARSGVRTRLADRLYYGWVIAAACLLTSVAVFGTTYSFSVFFERMLASFPGSRARLSLAFGVQTLTLYVGASIAGPIVDRIGPRRALPVGGAFLAAGLLATSRSDRFLELIASYGVLTAFGLAVLYVVAYATVPRWFGRRRGAANGIATSGLGVGLLAVTPAASALIGAFGWRRAYVAFAAAVVVLVAVVSLLFADSPEAVGADSSAEFPEIDGGAPGRDGDASAGRARADGDAGATPFAVPPVVRTPAFALVFVGWLFVYATLYAVLGHLVLFADDVGLGPRVGVLAISVVGATTTAARLGLGALSDRIGRVRMFVACSALMAATTLLFAAARSPATLWATAALYGVGYGGNGALLSPLVADLFGEERIGSLYGAMSISFGVAGLLAPPAAGLVYARLGSYVPAFVALGAVGFVGAACVYAAGRRTGAVD